jgi:5-methylcytosine-specific restriction protein A
VLLAEPKAAIDRYRPSAWRRGYTGEWAQYRADYLRRHPRCACGAPATVVDHVKPVALGGAFWDPANHRQMCARCHNAKTMSEINARRVPRMERT